MTAASSLKTALKTVDWNTNVATMLADEQIVERVARCGYRIAVWSKQLESADKGNLALPFIRDMQISGQYVAALAGLALYRPAAYCIRCTLESALYYTYFRVHTHELGTLISSSKYYVDKNEIIEWHKTHTPQFSEREASLGLISRIDKWYKELSALAHGQVPGAWVVHSSLSKVEHHENVLERVVATFEATEDVVHSILLCTVAQSVWDGFGIDAKKALLKGLSGKAKTMLGLTAM